MKKTTKTTEKAQVEQIASGGKHFQGIVVSDKMKDTIVVRVERYFQHPKYKKFISRSKKFMAHDEGNTKKIGDTVTIQETTPISKNKRFKVVPTTK